MWYLIAASLIFSFSFGLIGNQLAGLPAAWLASIRLAIAATLFIPFIRRIALRTGIALFVIGMIQFGVMSLCYMSSFRYLASHEVAFFTIMTPVYVVVLNDFLRQTFNKLNLAVALLSVCGAGLILWRGIDSTAPIKGFLLVEASNLCFALGQLAYRETINRSTIPLPDKQVFFWLYLGGLVALAPFGLSDAIRLAPSPTWTQLGVLLYLGVLVSGLSYFLWNAGARRVNPGVLAVMNNVKIPLGMLVSLLFFDEKIQATSLLAGSLLVMASLLPPLLRSKE